MKKLESLNSSLFEKFEGKKVNNLALCTGGTQICTKNSKGNDCIDTATRGGYFCPSLKIWNADYGQAAVAPNESND